MNSDSIHKKISDDVVKRYFEATTPKAEAEKQPLTHAEAKELLFRENPKLKEEYDKLCDECGKPLCKYLKECSYSSRNCPMRNGEHCHGHAKPAPKGDGEISLCRSCHCMTNTIPRCGKCGIAKVAEPAPKGGVDWKERFDERFYTIKHDLIWGKDEKVWYRNEYHKYDQLASIKDFVQSELASARELALGEARARVEKAVKKRKINKHKRHNGTNIEVFFEAQNEAWNQARQAALDAISPANGGV